jgi:hypothetical protein
VQLLLLGDEGLVSILDGMFVSAIFEQLGYLCPFLALVPHVGNQNVVLLQLPFLL